MYDINPLPEFNPPDANKPPTLIGHVDSYVPHTMRGHGIDDDGIFLYVFLLLCNRAGGGVKPEHIRKILKWDTNRFAPTIASLIDTGFVLRHQGDLWCECLTSRETFLEN